MSPSLNHSTKEDFLECPIFNVYDMFHNVGAIGLIAQRQKHLRRSVNFITIAKCPPTTFTECNLSVRLFLTRCNEANNTKLQNTLHLFNKIHTRAYYPHSSSSLLGGTVDFLLVSSLSVSNF